MTTKTDLSRDPYFDDYDANNHFHRVLYHPRRPVQTRELTQGQTILQDQIEKFGRHIFTEGSVVENCQLTFEPGLHYVKVRDTYANGTSFTIADFKGQFVEANNGLRALVTDVVGGSTGTAPDLNTLYVNYVNAGNDGVTKFFSADQILTVKTSSNNTIGTVQTANTGISGNSDFFGFGYRMGVSNGTIFQKGFFIGVEAQTLLVSKYDNNPDGISVGFDSIETIVTPEQDPSLLDNAAGSPNYAAPGAHRLKMTPTLTIQPTDGVNVPNNFFSIVDFIEGTPARESTDPTYSLLGAEMARRTDEESGNYVIEPFNMRTLALQLANGANDTSNLKLEVDPGLAYIHGFRVNTTGKIVSKIRQGTDIRHLAQQVVTVTLGNYVFADEFSGHWDTLSGATVSLRNSTANTVTVNVSRGDDINGVSPPGSEIGTAQLLTVKFDSGDDSLPSALYRVYLFNVKMNSGQNFASVRSLYTITGGAKGFADVILDSSNNAILQEPNFRTLVYPLNTVAMKTLKDTSNNVVTEFDYETHQTIHFSNNGTASISVPTHVGGTNEWPYGIGTLDSITERDFIIVSDTAANTANGAGGVDITGGANTATWHLGNTDDFSGQLKVGDLFVVGNATSSETRRVTFANVSTLGVANAFSNTWSNAAHWSAIHIGQVLPFAGRTAETITITSSTAASINIGRTFVSSFDATVYHNVRRTIAKPAAKKLNSSIFVKIDTDTHSANVVGPWSLGLPDVISLKNVWIGGSFANTNPSGLGIFTLDNGQRDLSYDLASIKLYTGSVAANSKILVEVAAFVPDTSQGIGFFSVDSYPIEDVSPTSNTILTQNIPVYTSPLTGAVYPLRNSIDFRIVCSNTAARSNTIGGATTNPSNTVTYSLPDGTFFPVVDSSFQADIQYYLGRKDVVGMTTKGRITVTEGTPFETPAPPVDVQTGITLAEVNVPPYPTLSTDAVKNLTPAGQKGATTFTYKKNRRYTMADIGLLDSRISTVEYYTSLNTLEQSTKDLLIPSDTGGDRFKNGIFVDPFNVPGQYGDATNFAYNIAIDSNETTARPVFDSTTFDMKIVGTDLVTEQPANSTSNGIYRSVNGRLILLGNEELTTPYLLQGFATQLRNPSQDVAYRWAGTVALNPDGDYRPDVTVNPDRVVNLGTFQNITATGGSPTWSTTWGAWQETSQSSTISQSGGGETYLGTSVYIETPYQGADGQWYLPDVNSGEVLPVVVSANVAAAFPYGGTKATTVNRYLESDSDTTVTTTVDYGRVGTQMYAADPSTANYSLGSYVTDVSLQPYIRAQRIDFTAHGLKPGARHWFFFDDDSITDNIVTYHMTDAANTSNPFAVFGVPAIFTTGNAALTRKGKFVSADLSHVTDATGALYGSFYIPANKYRTGERKFRVLDIENLVTEMEILQSSSSTTFYGTNLSYAKNNITLQVGTQQIYTATVYDTTSVTSSSTTPGATHLHDVVINCDCYASPCAQSFRIPQEQIQNEDIPVIFISRIQLFFERKDPVLGLRIMIREMENGYPSPIIVPFGETHLTSAQVNLSEDATVPTDVIWDAPLMLSTNKEYCIVVQADGFNPNYALWTGALGGSPDVTSGLPVFHNSFVGNLFTSSNDTGWTAYQQEDFKISIYRLSFTTLDATAVFTNDDSEYLQKGGQLGTFFAGETIYFTNNAIQTNGAIVQSGNTKIALTNTAMLAANSKIYVLSNTFASALTLNVASVTNSTVIVVNTTPTFSDSDCEVGFLKNGLQGFLKINTNAANTITIGQSTANSSQFVTANTRYIGVTSGASANIVAVRDMPYNTVMPKLSTSVPAETALTFTFKGTSNSSTSYVLDSNPIALNFAQDLSLYDRERVVLSRSNEIVNSSGAKSLQVFAHFQSVSEKISPAIDMIKAGMLGIHNIVNAETANDDVFTSEKGNLGLAINRYISKVVTLADGQDAEDLRVYLAMYKPAGTDVYVYAKVENADDGENFDTKAWTPMATLNTAVSSKSNQQDFVEYTYNLPSANTDPGDHSVYLNANNNSIARYTNAGGQIFDTYKTFSLKIVLLANESNLVPRLQDVRAIALMV